MMEIEVIKYEKYARDLKRLLICSGLWPNIHPVVRTIVAYAAGFSTFVTALAMLNFSIHHINNIMLATRGMGLVISFFTCVLKVWLFLLHQDEIIYLNKYLSDKFASDLRNISDRPLVLSHLRVIVKLFYALTYTVGVSCSLSYVIAFLGLRHGKYVLVFPSIFPFSYEPGGLVYWIVEIIELMANFFLWTLTSGVDSLFGYYTMQLCGELKVLANRFENLSTSSNYKRDLKECIERHHVLMHCQGALERLYGVLAIWLAITSAVIQCTLVFQATEIVKTSVSPFRFSFLCGYIMLKLVQAFTYALYGQLIAEESTLCLEAIYKARWPGSGDKKFMNDVLIILSQKPLVFTAKGCMYLKMDIFSKILNTSVSYFFLLQTLEEDS